MAAGGCLLQTGFGVGAGDITYAGVRWEHLYGHTAWNLPRIQCNHSETLVNPHKIRFHANLIGGYCNPLETCHFADPVAMTAKVITYVALMILSAFALTRPRSSKDVLRRSTWELRMARQALAAHSRTWADATVPRSDKYSKSNPNTSQVHSLLCSRWASSKIDTKCTHAHKRGQMHNINQMKA